MTDWLEALGAWDWLILGTLLLGAELLAPGGFMLWLGLAAILVGLISFAIEWAWQWQLVAFAVLAVISLLAWLRIGRRRRPAGKHALNRRAQTLSGRTFTLDGPIVDGAGTVHVDDTVWRVRGPDCPAGSKVRVVGADGALLIVDRVDVPRA